MSNTGLKVCAHLPMGCGQGLHTDEGPVTQQGGVLMKFRVYRLATTVAMLAVLIEALGAGAKWG